MRHLTIALLVAWCLACSGAPVPPAPPPPAPVVAVPEPPARRAPSDPAESIRGIYAAYSLASPPSQPWLPVATVQLADAWAKAAKAAELEGCGVPPIYQADLVVDAQDFQISNVRVEVKITGGKALATAYFDNFGQPHSVKFDLLLEDGQWRVNDIHAQGPSLREQIQSTIASWGGC